MGLNPRFRRPNPGVAGQGYGHNRNVNTNNKFQSRSQYAGKGNGKSRWNGPNQSFGPGNQIAGKGFNNSWNKPNQSFGHGNQIARHGSNRNPWNKPNKPSGLGSQNAGKGFNNSPWNKPKRQNRPQNVFTGQGGNRWGFNQGNQSPKDLVMEDVVRTPWGFGGFGKMDISSPLPRWGKPPSSEKRVAWVSSKDVSMADASISQLDGFQKTHFDDKNVQVRLENQHISLNGCYEVQVTQTVAVYKLGGQQDEIRVLDFPNPKEKRYEHLLARRKVVPRRKAFGRRQKGSRPKDTRRTGVPPYRAYKPLTKRVDIPKDRVLKKYRYSRKKVRLNQKVFGVVP